MLWRHVLCFRARNLVLNSYIRLYLWSRFKDILPIYVALQSRRTVITKVVVAIVLLYLFLMGVACKKVELVVQNVVHSVSLLLRQRDSAMGQVVETLV